MDAATYAYYHATQYVPQQQEFGQRWRELEQEKKDIAASSRRVHYIENFGANNQEVGYSGIFGNVSLGQSIGNYVDYPVTETRLGSNGADPIHLNTSGYQTLSENCYTGFLQNAFQHGTLHLNKTSVQFGSVLVGQAAASQTVTASNTGANFTKIGVQFASGTGAFSGMDNARDYLFKDPSLGSNTTAMTYGFVPTARGIVNQTATVSVEYGSNSSVSLSGKGVAPVNQVQTSVSDYVRAGDSVQANIMVKNVGDGNLSGLGVISNLRGSVSVSGGETGFADTTTSNISLADGATQNISVPFSPTSCGTKTAKASFSFVNGNRNGSNQADLYSAYIQSMVVSPVFDSAKILELGNVDVGSHGDESFLVYNRSDDPDGGNTELTSLTLLGISITGPDADSFSLSGFTPGMTIEKDSFSSDLIVNAFNNGSSQLGKKPPC